MTEIAIETEIGTGTTIATEIAATTTTESIATTMETEMTAESMVADMIAATTATIGAGMGIAGCTGMGTVGFTNRCF